jgi:carboxymethylenebutenolidase
LTLNSSFKYETFFTSRKMGEGNLSSPAVAPAAYPSPQQISPHLTLQPPLSRRGKGPGLILILDHYAQIEESEKHLDPPPLQKWAEEGFAVVQLLVPGKVEDGGEFPLEKALEVLKKCEGCDYGKGVGVVCEFEHFLSTGLDTKSPRKGTEVLQTT